MSAVGKVTLVGAGPGRPDLITVAGVEHLQTADVVVYDKLVAAELLDHCRPGCERIYVGKSAVAGEHVTPQKRINAILVDHARRGRTVVRLKGGDPLTFARGAEEIEHLRRHGIPYEIVPGVTAASACAATAAIPLTHRDHASAVAFVTGHEDPTKRHAIDWRPLAEFPGTLVVYMGLTRIGPIAAELVRLGKAGDTPVALVQEGGTARQVVHESTLARLQAGPPPHLRSPVLTVIGPTVSLRRSLDWYGRRPLSGLRVWVPRPADAAAETAAQLASLGADPICEPVMTFAEPEDWEPVDRAFEGLSAAAYDVVTFASRRGVHAFLDRLLRIEWDFRILASSLWWVVGESTAKALVERGLHADRVAEDADGLAATVAAHCRHDPLRILHVGAAEGRDDWLDGLDVRSAEVVHAYRQVAVSEPSARLTASLTAGEVNAVLLTSGNVATAALEWCGRAAPPERWPLAVCISRRVAEVAAECGAERIEVAAAPSISATVDVLRSRATAGVTSRLPSSEASAVDGGG